MTDSTRIAVMIGAGAMSDGVSVAAAAAACGRHLHPAARGKGISGVTVGYLAGAGPAHRLGQQAAAPSAGSALDADIRPRTRRRAVIDAPVKKSELSHLSR